MFSLTALGIGIGFFAALLGLGGNIFIIPFLPMIKQMTLQEVIASGIFTVSLVTLFNSIKFYRLGVLNLPLIMRLFPATAGAGFVGARYRESFSDSQITMGLVSIIGLMIVRLLFFKPKKVTKGAYFISFITAGVSGLMGGITGIGTGVLLGPSLLSFNLCDHKEVSPAINALIFVNASFASFSQFSSFENGMMGKVHLEVVRILVLTSLVGSFFGRQLNQRISQPLRQRIVGIMLIFICLKLTIPHVHFFL